MNLKESFRYTKYLDALVQSGVRSIATRDHAFNVTKIHHRSKANPDAADKEEVVDNGDFIENDRVIDFIISIIEEKYNVTEAINKAKAGLEFDLDGAVESNKLRHLVSSGLLSMLNMEPVNRGVSRESDYKFNIEGNQVQYYYEVEHMYEDAFDRNKNKVLYKKLMCEADDISSSIDTAMVNADIEYSPKYNVNESFEDALERFECEKLA